MSAKSQSREDWRKRRHEEGQDKDRSVSRTGWEDGEMKQRRKQETKVTYGGLSFSHGKSRTRR